MTKDNKDLLQTFSLGLAAVGLTYMNRKKEKEKNRKDNIIITLLVAILLTLAASVFYSPQAKADGVYLFGGVFAYDDKATQADYDGLSPNGSYGIKYMHSVSRRFHVEAGIKHESSMAYREKGDGFNGVFANFNLKVF